MLNLFGKVLMEYVRDITIHQMDSMVEGKIKTADSKEVNKLYETFTTEQKEWVAQLIERTTDTALHYLLFMLDQCENIDVLVSETAEDKSQQVNMREASDGLCGELYSDEGWIQKYSNERYLHEGE